MIFFRSLIVFTFLIFSSAIANAQHKNSINEGGIKGVVRDSILNYVLRSATVSVYNSVKEDSTLISYQITNAYGEFNFNNLPLGQTLKLLVSNVGYQSYNRTFRIPVGTKFIDLNTIILNQKKILLKEVVISLPPISMNGDTLEFNADAFKLDNNSVVEDLLRKIPNVTLWGDGKITVNGRDVKSLLVNGKEFFGGDFKIATQNLEKNALEKIQVYKKAGNINPLDSTAEMNLKLKKGKGFGYFGKFGVGYGTSKRYDTDGSINAFNSKAQFSLVGVSNNTNKIANDVGTLRANSTFKGEGTRIEYRPDFRIGGITRSKAFGSNFTYNFIETPTNELKSTLSVNYFDQAKDNDNSSVSGTTTTTELSGKIFEDNVNAVSSYNSNKSLDSKYEWIKTIHSLTITQSLTRNNYEDRNESIKSSLSNENLPVSTNYSNNTSNGLKSNFNFKINYLLNENFARFRQRFKGMSVSFSINVDDDYSDKLNITDFKSYLDPNSSQKFNRKYQTNYNDVNQQLNFELPKLKELIFGNAFLLGLDFYMGNEAKLKNRRSANFVEDFNNSATIYEKNDYLSNQLKITTLEETPAFTISKSISRTLSNRFSKSFNISGSLKQKLIYQFNNSNKSFQNFRRNYSRFVPSGSMSYFYDKYGEFTRNYSISYNTSIQIPGLQQLAPLIDSTNIYNIQKGNFGLKESLTRSLSFSFSHEDQSTKNTLNYYLSVIGGVTKEAFTDSVFISDDNRRIAYLINSDGSKYLNTVSSIRKAFKLKLFELQISLDNSLNIYKSPGYVNGAFTFSRSLNTSTNLKLNFTYKGYLAVEGVQSYTTYMSSQHVFKTVYKGANISTTLSSSYSPTKKLTFSSNITFNRSNATNNAVINFAIWNATVACRFLKGSNLEIKLHALDLLRKNTSIINYGTFNSFTIGSQNVLQHYFMTTIAYYPRQFGRKTKK
jgi:hypothetical protein